MKPINVLSTFDGISCGMVALKRAGIPINNYYAFEIDKYAIKISEKNYPEIVHLGDVKKWKDIELPKIDLLLGGFPCQSHSIAGNRKGFDDPRGQLFFDMVDILNYYREINPDLKFLFENVSKITKDNLKVINNLLGVEPVLINSSLVSAQNRKRLYWTNFSDDIEQPEDRHIYLKDILEGGTGAIKSFGVYKPKEDKSQCLDANYWKGEDNHGQRTVIKTIGSSFYYRKLTPLECERLQTLPDGFTEGVSNSQRYKMIGNGWTIDVIVHLLKYYTKGE